MPRTNLMERRNYDAAALDLPVLCPAGVRIMETLEGPACACRIEGSKISAARDASSLAIFCMGDNTLCPTWRAVREAEWEHEDPTKLAAPRGAERTFSVEDMREIEERRAAGDVEGARRIADEIRERRRAQGLRDVPAE